MNLPKFNAESALAKSTRTYRGRPQFGSFSQSGVPAVVVQPNQLEGAEGLEGLEGLDGAEGLDETGLSADAAEGEEDVGDEGSDDMGDEDDSGLDDDGEDVGEE